MSKTQKPIIYVFFYISVYSLLLFLNGCGKNETAGSVMGTATGAIVGASVSGRNSQGTGALIGGLLGNVIGGGIGRSADREEEEIEREHQERTKARQQAMTQHELARAREENRYLKQTMVKWCADCGREVNIMGARSCPCCGGDLIREKSCRMCAAVFSPKAGYQYCPYCRDGVLLSSR